MLQGLRPILALSKSPGPDITLDSGGKQAVHISLFLTTLTSPDLPLSPAQSTCLFHLPTLYSLTIMVSDCPVP